MLSAPWRKDATGRPDPYRSAPGPVDIFFTLALYTILYKETRKAAKAAHPATRRINNLRRMSERWSFDPLLQHHFLNFYSANLRPNLPANPVCPSTLRGTLSVICFPIGPILWIT